MDTLIYKLVLSLLLGAFIGIERQMHAVEEQNKSNLGLRTFALITSLGAICGFIGNYLPSVFLLLSGSIFLLVIAYYIFDSYLTKDYGITTEITLFFSYILGIMVAHDIFSQQLLIGMTVVLVLVLSLKEQLSSYVRLIKAEELQSFIRYAVIALVILPLLPNIAYHIGDLPYSRELLQTMHLPLSLRTVEFLNPFQLWLVVALITGIDVLGYILERIFGHKKGWFLASFIGGFVSSTATTHSLANQSKIQSTTNVFVIAAIAATLASFIEQLFIIIPLNIFLFVRTIFVLLLMVAASGLLIYFFSRQEKGVKETFTVSERHKKELFHLYPAIKFAILFVIIKFVSSLALQLFGTNGFLLAIGLGAIPGMDAALITIAQSAGTTVSFQLALYAFILANFVNLLVKCVLVIIDGKREFAIKFSISTAIILLMGFLGVLVQVMLF